MSNEAKGKPPKNLKNDAKEQRKRPSKNQAKKKDVDGREDIPAQQTDTTEAFKNLKRETEEIHKLTDEANSKYNKKQIQSNWHKYEILPENNEHSEELQYLGADYEQLSQMPMSVGNHFQFKHEKSWDSAVASSEFDKYFNMNFSNLSFAINCIPFYERNNIDRTIFSKGDYSNMDHSAKRNKLKYDTEKSLRVNTTESQLMVVNEATEELKLVDYQSLALEDVIGDKEVIDLPGESMAHISSDLETKLAEATLKETEPLAVLISNDQTGLQGALLDVQTDGTLKNKPEMKQEECVKNAPKDLEKWLDDFLDT